MPGRVTICPSCSTKNRVPAVASGRPRCASCKADLPWIADATDADFAQVVATKELVLVDLWAPWCGPCRMVAPVLERLAERYVGRLKVVKVNVDDNPAIAAEYGITSIPAVYLFQGGEVKSTVIGAKPKQFFEKEFSDVLS